MGGQARSIWTENMSQMTVLAFICEKSLRPRGLLQKFSSEAFLQTSGGRLAGT